ncbi:MAG: type I glutamate--ammonia ligase, partial [Phycisphaerae bacterium]|nr:type I glutamate--ammonia ligase [Phycisphaerae bacterium]
QPEEFRKEIASLPRSLYEALDALGRDHEFLVKGDVFPAAFISRWIVVKRRDETEAINARPHPYEYELYLDC